MQAEGEGDRPENQGDEANVAQVGAIAQGIANENEPVLDDLHGRSRLDPEKGVMVIRGLLCHATFQPCDRVVIGNGFDRGDRLEPGLKTGAGRSPGNGYETLNLANKPRHFRGFRPKIATILLCFRRFPTQDLC